MAESSIPVDLMNPGQVFACLGLLELADQFLGEAQAAFDCSDESNILFRLSAQGNECPMGCAIAFLRGASVTSRTPAKADLSTNAWGVESVSLNLETDAFPFPKPGSPATLPASLIAGERMFDLIHWGDDISSSGRDNVKFWAGAGGYPGAALAQDALDLIRAMPDDVTVDPLNAAARQTSSFRFDWRRDYVPLDVGFSLNAHSGDRFVTVGYPIVEMLAAIGLTHARPKRLKKLCYHYAVIASGSEDQRFDPVFHRAALGVAEMPFPLRTFRMNLGWPGKENQARCITTIEELTK